MVSDKQQQLINTLKELFMMDQADLNFGIYRIMNAKHDEIESFLTNDLLTSIRQTLQTTGKASNTKKELDDAIKSAQALGMNPDDSPKVQELKALLGNGAENSLENDENEIFSQLTTFFSRYYDGGDFMSLRRYKKETYSPLPMNGEEVKLHWANADQYYIKSAENFSQYAFKIGAENQKKHFRFELVAASTEQNNVKAIEDKERRFILDKSNPLAIKQTESGNELLIHFSYQADAKKRKQKELNLAAIKFLSTLEANNPLVEQITEWTTWQSALLTLIPTEKNKTRTALEKHLNDYTAKNSFDYFIHKDLGVFLRRELDFFIKNELLLLDDLVPSSIDSLQSQLLSNERSLKKVIAFKGVAQKLIAFLAQLENFQKKLWLKKKFVHESHYCMTLDRVPESFYQEIANNDKQAKEWLSLGVITENTVISVDFLEENPFLLIDTALFSVEFKQSLLAEIDDLDESIDGLLIHSENFQALQLLEVTYCDKVKGIYTDPPYNTDASSILYKNNYKDSSWLSLIKNLLNSSSKLLTKNGLFCLAIDDEEVAVVKSLLNSCFEKEIGVAVVRSNPQSRKTKGKFSPVHEYALFYGKSNDSVPSSLGITKKRMLRYPKKDSLGQFAWMNFIRTGNNDKRKDRPKLYYPIYVDTFNNIRIPKMQWSAQKEEYEVLEPLTNNETIIYPVSIKNGIRVEKNWHRGYLRVASEPEEYRIRRNSDNKVSIDFKTRMDTNAMPTTWWDKGEYASANYGAAELKDLFGDKPFDFPKAQVLVEDCIRSLGVDSNNFILDFFAGSGTTAHAVINLNREDNGKRKYILAEMGDHFNKVLKPRIKKVAYSESWKDGKPQPNKESKFNGISHCFKYLRLESYEDVQDNLQLQRTTAQTGVFDNPANKTLKEDYLLHYMLDIEAQDSLLSPELFVNPFHATMRVVRDNESRTQSIDLVETFNYLLGLRVKTYRHSKGIVEVTGKNPQDQQILILWRDCVATDNNALDDWFKKQHYNSRDMEFDLIYVNGDNNLPNLRTGDETWKVQLIEEIFQTLMFDVKDI